MSVPPLFLLLYLIAIAISLGAAEKVPAWMDQIVKHLTNHHGKRTK